MMKLTNLGKTYHTTEVETLAHRALSMKYRHAASIGPVTTLVIALIARAHAAPPSLESLLFSAEGPTSRIVYIADADGSNPHPLTSPDFLAYNARFSRNGNWIVFTSEKAGSADIYRMHRDGTGVERLTDSPSFDDQGELSPNGKTLVFVSTRNGGKANIWLLELASHRYRQITTGGSGNFRPAWSPDGKWIAFTSDRDQPKRRNLPQWELKQYTAVYRMRTDGAGVRRLSGLGTSDIAPQWSADGRTIIYQEGPEFYKDHHVVAVDFETGMPASAGTQPAVTFDKHPSWSPDGKSLVFDQSLPPEQSPPQKLLRPYYSRDDVGSPGTELEFAL